MPLLPHTVFPLRYIGCEVINSDIQETVIFGQIVLFVFVRIRYINEYMHVRIIRILMEIILDIGNIERCFVLISFYLNF